MKKERYLQGSIKEAFDNLPSGICFFAENGLPVLCNRSMYRLALAVTGKDLQTLSELESALKDLPEEAAAVRDGDTYILPDQTAWRFTFEKITDESGQPFIQAEACEVTALYKGSRELAGNIDRLKEVQDNIRSMTKDIAAITRENEILSMKMRIHDELGGSLLKLRRYYLGTDPGTKEELLTNWRNTVSMLRYKSRIEKEGDPLADLRHSAEAIGVEIVQFGEMPENVAAARLIVRAIRACLTNAVRHAGGSCIYVKLTYNANMVTAVITNNGEPPKEEIVEGGGLSSLRKKIETSGGQMYVQSLPEFALKVEIPQTVISWQMN